MRFINGKPVIRCSSLNQLISCPASRTVTEKLGDVEEDDRASWEGQWCHYMAARRFIDKNGAMPPEGGLPLPDIPKDWKPVDSFAEWIVDYYHRAVMEDTPGDWAMEVEAEMLYEFTEFWLSGHVDINAVAPDASAVQFDDLKSGMNVVDAADCNWQVLGYAALFKRAYGVALKRIRGRIIQPRVKEGDDAKRVSSVFIDERGTWNDAGELVSEATINDVVPFIERKINEALANAMELNTGLKQCRWCPASRPGGCPAYEQEIEIMKMTLTKEALAAITANPDITVIARWAIAKKLLDGKLKKAAELLKELLEKRTDPTPLEVDGVKLSLADWRGAREIPDTEKAKVWEQVVNDLDEPRAYAALELSIPELERQYAAQFGLKLESKKNDSGEKQVENRFGQCFTRKTGKQLTIVG